MLRYASTLLVATAAIDPAIARAAAPTPGQLCLDAAAAAERLHGLPTGLLLSIGLAETGRLAGDGTTTPWPWTLDVEGRGAFFPTQKAALAGLRTALAGGLASVDVGCFQVNLLQHPNAFSSLSDALNPESNADYAARLLVSLHTVSIGWPEAVARYHSNVLSQGERYRLAVLKAWSGYENAENKHRVSDPHIIYVAFAPQPRSSGLPKVIGPRGALSQ